MSVTLRTTCGSMPTWASTRLSVSTHVNVAAWPMWVVSYGVMPHT